MCEDGLGAHLIGIDNDGGRCSWLPGLFCDNGIPITSSLPGRRCNIHACLGCQTVTAVGRRSHLSFACSAGLSSKMELVFRSGVPCFFHQNFGPWGVVCLFYFGFLCLNQKCSCALLGYHPLLAVIIFPLIKRMAKTLLQAVSPWIFGSWSV